MADRKTFERDLHRDAVMTDAAMKGALGLAGIRFGFTPDETFVYYPKWAAKWPRKYREEVADYLIKMSEPKPSEFDG